jgi:hypothetical protein
MAQSIDDLNKEIDSLRKQLGKQSLSPFDQKDLQKAKEALSGLRNELREMDSDLNYISQSFRDSVAELSKQNAQLTIARNSIKGISNLARDLVDYRKGENDLSEKQLKNLQRQSKLKFDDLQATLKSGKLTAAQANEVKETLSQQEAFNKSLERTIDIQAEVNKEIGLLGSGLEGAGKFLEKMGFTGIAKPISDAIQATKKARFELKLNQDAIKAIKDEYETLGPLDIERKKELREQLGHLNAQNKELDKQTNKYKNIASALKEQLTTTNLTDAVIGSIVKGFTELNKAQVEFTRETGRNIPHLDTLNASLISSVDYIKTATELTQQFGLAADAIFPKETIESAAKLQVLMGLSAEEAGNAASLSKLNGTSLKDQSQAILDQVGSFNKVNKSALTQKGILKDVYNTSQTMQIAMGGNVKKITEANAAARNLGLSLKDVEGISDNLLDIESSIASEYEAEVLTGKQLNLEAARYYALQNDMAGVAKEIGKNQEIIGAFASGNRIQQEAIAKAMGMSTEQVSQMIFQQQKLAGVTDEQAAKNSGMKLEDLERLSVQESITKSMEKMGQALAGPLEMLASMLDNLMQFSGIITTIIGSFILLKGIQLTMLGIQQAQATFEALKLGYATAQRASALGYNGILMARQAIMGGELAKAVGIAAAYAVANPFTALAGLAVAAGVGAVVYSQMKDGIIDTKKGPVMSGEFGSVQLDPNDKAMYGADGKIKVGTNLNPTTQIKQPQQTVVQQSPSIDYDKMAQAMSRVKVQTNLDGVNVSRNLQTPMGIATRKL